MLRIDELEIVRDFLDILQEQRVFRCERNLGYSGIDSILFGKHKHFDLLTFRDVWYPKVKDVILWNGNGLMKCKHDRH